MSRPKKPAADNAVTISVRFPAATHQAAKTEAEADRRSFNLFVVMAVDAAVERSRAKRK